MLNIFNFCDYWWLAWILPFLLGLALGWAIWSKWKKMFLDMEATAADLRKEIARLEGELLECGQDKSKLKGDLALCEGRYRELEYSFNEIKALKTDSDISSADLGAIVTNQFTESESVEDDFEVDSNDDTSTDLYAKIKSDNLQIVEGIGPKMESVLKENGIINLSMLAGKSTTELRSILDRYGDKYKIIDPSDWAMQAAYAADRNFDGLIASQKEDGSESKAEKLFIKLGIIKAFNLDDLKAIEGIGPKIESLLKDAGINTWRALSETSVARLNDILEAAGPRYQLADPGSWPKQAEYAANGDWDALEKYQDFLDGGKNPN